MVVEVCDTKISLKRQDAGMESQTVGCSQLDSMMLTASLMDEKELGFEVG